MNLYLGIDFGTSGARAVVIDATANICAEAQYPFDAQTADIWQTALFSVIEQIPLEVRGSIKAIAIDGTSSTVLLCDRSGTPVTDPILYNDARGVAVIDTLKAIAPPNHTVISATSSLAKLLWWLAADFVTDETDKLFPETRNQVSGTSYYFLHQADWLGFLLHGKLGISDYHNALKLGYDPEQLRYPDWLLSIDSLPHLPQIVKPGTPVGEVTREIADRFGLRRDCVVCAGTTDSIAAFLASGAKQPGEASTSLGSTLVLKLLSRDRVDDARYGIYSHRLGDLWLAGGASNTGGAVLRQFFTDEELAEFSCHIDSEKESQLDYYPLTKPGDRFPINDPHLLPRMEPRPDNRGEFLHGLLESIARIETRGYKLLQELGATQLARVYTAGGGAKNPAWTAIRQRHLQVPVLTPVHTAAAYGTALLARQSVATTSVATPPVATPPVATPPGNKFPPLIAQVG